MASSSVGIVLLLGLAGLCLGVFVPANDALIMRTGTASTAGTLGGLINMAPGIGTALGIALVTPALHAGTGRPGGRLNGTLGLLLLLPAAAAAAAAIFAAVVRPLPASRGGDEPAGRAGAEHSGAFS